MFNLQDVPLTDFSVLSFRIEKTNKKWYSLNNAGYFIHLPAECKQILIKGNASFKTHYAFLTTLSPVANDVAPLVGEVNVIPPDKEGEGIVLHPGEREKEEPPRSVYPLPGRDTSLLLVLPELCRVPQVKVPVHRMTPAVKPGAVLPLHALDIVKEHGTA